MERNALADLQEWKESPSRKPLVLQGARQVGKTWLLKEFGVRFYQNVAYVNFEANDRMDGKDRALDNIYKTINKWS